MANISRRKGVKKDKKKKRKRCLSDLDVETFMALSSCESDEDELSVSSKNKKRKVLISEANRHENRVGLEEQEAEESSDEGEEEDQVESGKDDEEEGVVEPRPFDVTSWKEKTKTKEEESDEAVESEDEDTPTRGEKEGVSGPKVTLKMIRHWSKLLEKSQCVRTLRKLCVVLHTAVTNILPQEEEETHSPAFTTSAVFNALVSACFQHVSVCLHHHFPTTTTKGKGVSLPSSQGTSWRRLRITLRCYLADLLSLAKHLQDTHMQCSVLKQVQSLSTFFLCFPKLLRQANKLLVLKWATADSHVRVLAFLCLHRLVVHQPHPQLHPLLKKLYLEYVRNCKFSSLSNLPDIKFMHSSLVELLSVDVTTTYQHGFVYIRQLAMLVRTALTSGKKDTQQTVYNWQFVHCLRLWTSVVCEVKQPELRPLLYPLIQTVMATLGLQPSAKYHPLRLHLTKLLLQLSENTNTYIPIAPYLLEVLEEHGTETKTKLQTGKPPDLDVCLRATKLQLGTRSFRVAMVNEAFQQLLQYFVAHAHYISFPELSFPALVRLRQVSKKTPYSWLRTQLKQLIEKVEVVGTTINKDRLLVTFSPKDFDQVTSWESHHKEKESVLSKFLSTWNKLKALDAKTTPNPEGMSGDPKDVVPTPREKYKVTKTTQQDLKMDSDSEVDDDDSEVDDVVQDLTVLSD